MAVEKDQMFSPYQIIKLSHMIYDVILRASDMCIILRCANIGTYLLSYLTHHFRSYQSISAQLKLETQIQR